MSSGLFTTKRKLQNRHAIWGSDLTLALQKLLAWLNSKIYFLSFVQKDILHLIPSLNKGLKSSRALRFFLWVLVSGLKSLVWWWYSCYRDIASSFAICCLNFDTRNIFGLSFILYVLKLTAGVGFWNLYTFSPFIKCIFITTIQEKLIFPRLFLKMSILPGSK